MVTDQFLPDRSGVVTAVTHLVKAFRARRHEVLLIAPDSYAARTWAIEHDIGFVGTPSFHWPGRYRYVVPLPDRHLVKLLKTCIARFRPDLVHAHAPMVVGYAALRIANRQAMSTIATCHTLPQNLTGPLGKRFVKNRALNRLTRLWISRGLDLADLISAPTSFAAQQVRLQYNLRAVVVSNGIAIPNITALRDALAHDTSFSMRILHVSRQQSEKDNSTILYAFAQFLENTAFAYLVIVGDGPDLARNKALARRLKIQQRVHFAGLVDSAELETYYRDAHVAVVTSSIELQSYAALEALSYGVPVVACDAGATRETITASNGELAGALFEAGSPASLCAALKAMLSPEHRESCRQIAERVAKRHDIRDVARHWEHTYAGMTNSN